MSVRAGKLTTLGAKAKFDGCETECVDYKRGDTLEEVSGRFMAKLATRLLDSKVARYVTGKASQLERKVS